MCRYIHTDGGYAHLHLVEVFLFLRGIFSLLLSGDPRASLLSPVSLLNASGERKYRVSKCLRVSSTLRVECINQYQPQTILIQQ